MGHICVHPVLLSLFALQISAQYRTFVAYSTGSSSVVLKGTNETTVEDPEIVPELQNRNIISLIIGDYHYGALTSTGKLLTWGDFSRGALGLGDPTAIEVGQPGGYPTDRQRQVASDHGGPFPPRVTEPTEVRFDHHEKRSRRRFCFAATAAGWHTGALAIDLEVSYPYFVANVEPSLSLFVCISPTRRTRMKTPNFQCQEVFSRNLRNIDQHTCQYSELALQAEAEVGVDEEN